MQPEKKQTTNVQMPEGFEIPPEFEKDRAKFEKFVAEHPEQAKKVLPVIAEIMKSGKFSSPEDMPWFAKKLLEDKDQDGMPDLITKMMGVQGTNKTTPSAGVGSPPTPTSTYNNEVSKAYKKASKPSISSRAINPGWQFTLFKIIAILALVAAFIYFINK